MAHVMQKEESNEDGSLQSAFVYVHKICRCIALIFERGFFVRVDDLGIGDFSGVGVE